MSVTVHYIIGNPDSVRDNKRLELFKALEFLRELENEITNRKVLFDQLI